jgi:ribosomal protein S18 acetylase RimI-like enzyme
MVVVEIRRIRADEGLHNRDVRIRGLVESPDAFQSTVAGAEARPEAYWHELAQVLARGEARVLFVIDSGDRFEGTAGGTLYDRRTMVEVVGVWVDPAYRGRGLGTALVEEALAWGRERGATRARLWVHDQNQTAIRLYERLGFTMTDQCEQFGQCGERRRCMMVRDLDPVSAS